MGIAMLAAARLVQVVPVWVDGLRPRMAADRPGHRSGSRLARAGREQAQAGWHGMARLADDLLARLVSRRDPDTTPLHGRTAHAPARPLPLRVLRVLEPQQPRAAAGRMVISGRMADVCAELDRLAAAEVATRQ